MFLLGDEVRRTQHGNNNAYCQDSEANWFDWGLLKKHADIHRFVKLLCTRRLSRDMTSERRRMNLTQVITQSIKGWHGAKLNHPDWSDYSHSVAFSADLSGESLLVYFIFNAYWEPINFELPRIDQDGINRWRRWIDTYLEMPQDIVRWQRAVSILYPAYEVGPRSVVVLWATIDNGTR
jgi:glycogen operon protein